MLLAAQTFASRSQRVLRPGWRRLAAGLAASLATLGAAHGQETISLTRQDRQVLSARVHLPKLPACRGVALVSPGAGGSADGNRYLAEALSLDGYLAVVMGHPESGRDALREQVRRLGLAQGLAALITQPAAYEGRFMDIDAARAWARARCESPQAVLVGHSMGAATVMLEAGARNRLGLRGASAFDAYIALSPQGVGSIFPEHAWADLRRPVLMITGTRDLELGQGRWESRMDAFADMPAGCKWLAVIDGATHMNLGGEGRSGSVESHTTRVIHAFLRAWREGSCQAPPAVVDGLRLSTK